MAVALRGYQEDALGAIARERRLGVPRTAVVAGTGAGKTTIMAELGRRHIAAGGRRVLYVVHRRELIDQILDRVRGIADGQTAGVVMAERNSCQAQHVIASVQTIGGDRGATRRRMIRGVDLGVVDECHHAAAKTYGDVFGHYGHEVPWVGFTATLTRQDRKALGKIWKSVAYEKGLSSLIEEGWLVRPVGVRVQVEDLDLTRVKSTGGDLQQGDLGEAIEGSMAPVAIAKALREHAPDRPTILFAPTVHSARVIEDALSASGFTTALVWGAMTTEARKAALSDYRAGNVQVLVNCMVLTEGTDLPLTSCIVIARPTKSRGLYQQMVGRGLRTAPGKSDCLVLDLVGVSSLGLSSCTDLFGEDKPAPDRRACSCAGVDESCVHAQCHEDCGCGWTSFAGCYCEWEPVVTESVIDDPPIYVDGPLRSTIVDLFTGSSSMWMRTTRGVPFIAAGERYIAIVPADPARRRRLDTPEYEIVSLHWQDWNSARYVMTGVTDFATAMQYAEGDLTLAERRTSAKEDGFRKRRIKSTEYQRAMATSYGITTEPGALASELQVRLAEAGASARIDPCLPDWY